MKILLVDDDNAILKLLDYGLSCEGHEVLVCDDPCEAVRTISADIDLVISDLCMPGLDGLSLAGEVSRALGAHPPRVLLMSGYVSRVENSDMPPVTVIGMLTKPFSLDDLVEIVEVIGRTRDTCPGLVYEELACERSPSGELLCAHHNGHCRSCRYAVCEGYSDAAGRKLQDWIKFRPGERLALIEDD